MRTCPFCGTDNESFFKFCLACGADLDEAVGADAEAEAAVVPQSEPAAPAAGADEVRVTGKSRAALKARSKSDPIPSTMVKHRKSSSGLWGDLPLKTPEDEAAAVPMPSLWRLVLILEDGSDGTVFEVQAPRTTLGRGEVQVAFAHDEFLAETHCYLETQQDGSLVIAPQPSMNGVFVQVREEVELRHGDIFRVGQELLRFELLSRLIAERPDKVPVTQGSPIPEGAWGRLGQLIGPEECGAVYLLGGTDIYLGRERGDITFPSDGFVSALHAVVMHRDERFFLKDLGSSNGTYYRLAKPQAIENGSLMLAGQQLFRVER